MPDNNLNGYVSYVRDTFLGSEGEYAKQIQDLNQNSIEGLSEYHSEMLYKLAKQMMDEVEYTDKFNWEDMEQVEVQIIALLSAIKDVTLRKELILTPDYEEEKSYTLRRRR